VHDHVETLGEVLLGAGRADVGHRADGYFDGVDAGDRIVEDGCGPSVTGDVGAGDEPEALGAAELPQCQAGAGGELQGAIRLERCWQ
jgi:hypothetical protein